MMKIKKKLKEVRKKIDEQILSEHQDLYDKLVSKHFTVNEESQKESKNKHNIRNWILAVSCVLVVCLVVGLSVSLTKPKESEYLVQNQVCESATLDEFRLATNSTITFSDNYSISKISRIYDSVSSDTLEYRLYFDHKEEFKSGELYVVVNSRFKFPEDHLSEIINTTIGKYDMEYSVQETTYEGYPINKYFGCIEYVNYKLYFSFEEFKSESSNSSPLSSLNDLLILK